MKEIYITRSMRQRAQAYVGYLWQQDQQKGYQWGFEQWLQQEAEACIKADKPHRDCFVYRGCSWFFVTGSRSRMTLRMVTNNPPLYPEMPLTYRNFPVMMRKILTKESGQNV